MKQTLKNKIVGVVASGVLLAELAFPIVDTTLNSRSYTVNTSRGKSIVRVWNEGHPYGIELYPEGSLIILSDTDRDYKIDRKTHIVGAPRRGVYRVEEKVTEADQSLFYEATSKTSIL